MQVGIDTFVAAFDDKSQAVDPSQRVQDFLDPVEFAVDDRELTAANFPRRFPKEMARADSKENM